jgi:hypothetical protein
MPVDPVINSGFVLTITKQSVLTSTYLLRKTLTVTSISASFNILRIDSAE